MDSRRRGNDEWGAGMMKSEAGGQRAGEGVSIPLRVCPV